MTVLRRYDPHTPLLPCCNGLAGTPPEHTEGCPRYFTRLGDHRERGVPCVGCQQETWALDVLCDQCAARKGMVGK